MKRISVATRMKKAKKRGFSIKKHLGFAFSWVKHRFERAQVVPFSKSVARRKGMGFHHNGQEYVHYTDLHLKDSAFARLTTFQVIIIYGLFLSLVLGLLLNWHVALVVIISVLSVIYFVDLLFNFFLIYRSFFQESEIEIKEKELAAFHDTEWPTYTVLCPLYKEGEILPQFVRAMSSLDYPKNKLKVLLLLEKDDKETIWLADRIDLPHYFDVVVIPHSLPKTKPKALNFGLKHTTSEYVVIYDAEDVPDPLQLKKAVIAFRKMKGNVVCIQAKLNFYNPTQNILTRLFTIEYSLWFDLVLTGLQSIHAPIPLGGTSNHFKVKDLEILKRWDPFNVTEDADLGMRIVKKGFKTAIMNSYTMEEANSNPLNWFRQRSRWIKGYIQTYLVHMRRPHEFFISWKSPHFLTFQLVIGAKILSMIVNPVMWAMTIAYFGFHSNASGFIHSLYIAPVFYIAAISLVIGNFLYMYYYMLGAAKRNQWDLIPYAVLTPVYWLGMSVAAFYAILDFLLRPHYWQKTKHGLHLVDKKTSPQPVERPRPRIALSPA